MCSERVRRSMSRPRTELPSALSSSSASPASTPRADQLFFIELSLANFLAVDGDVRRSFDADADLLVLGRNNGDNNPVADENSLSFVANVTTQQHHFSESGLLRRIIRVAFFSRGDGFLIFRL